MFIPLAVAILPAIALVWLFKKWDQKRPEPPGMIRRAMIFGALSCIPAGIIEVVVSAILGKDVVEAQGQLVNSFAIAAGTEEAGKLAIVMLYFWRKQEFNEVMDGILYTAATSLGFALLENVMYAGGNLVLGFARAISAVPLHACASGIMGYFVGRAKMTGGATGKIVAGYLIAVAIHGFYDWSVFSGGMYGLAAPQPLLGFGIAVLIVLVASVVVRGLVKKALDEDDQLLGSHPRPLLDSMPVAVPYAGPNPYAPPAVPYGQPGYVPFGAAGYAAPPAQPYAPSYPQGPQPYPQGYAQPYTQQPQAQPYGQPPPYAQPHSPQQPYAQQPYAQQPQPYPQQPQPYAQQPQQPYAQQPQPYAQTAQAPPPPGGWPPNNRGPQGGWGG